MKGFRVIPLVMLVGVALLFLKTVGLLVNDGYLFRGKAEAETPESNHSENVSVQPVTEKKSARNIEAENRKALNAAKSRAIQSGEVSPPVDKAEVDQVSEQRGLFSNDIARMLDAENTDDNITFFDPVTQQLYQVGKDEITSSIEDEGPEATSNDNDDQSGKGAVEALGEDDPSRESAENSEDARPRDVLVERNQSEQTNPVSDTERKLLERLRERRAIIKQSEKDLRLRELALEAVEKRLDDKIAELKALEAQVKGMITEKGEEAEARINDLVEIYSKMKAKAAARIFDQLKSEEIIDIAVKMQPRSLSSILALMQADKARELTLLMLGQSRSLKPKPVEAKSLLPRVEGLPVEATSAVQ